MKLHPPFKISARLLPALKIADSNGAAWLSYDPQRGQFVIDLPDGAGYWIEDFHAGPGVSLADQFAGILSFLGACAESRSYAERRGKDPMDGENSDLFPPHVGKWTQQMSDEIAMLQIEIEESETELIELN